MNKVLAFALAAFVLWVSPGSADACRELESIQDQLIAVMNEQIALRKAGVSGRSPQYCEVNAKDIELMKKAVRLSETSGRSCEYFKLKRQVAEEFERSYRTRCLQYRRP